MSQAPAQLQKTLRRRHVEMIAIGGIIGAGLFVGSSSAIATVGPAAIVSYAIAGLIVLAVMRMLTEMAMAVPGVQSFPDFARAGLGQWAGFISGWLYWYFWVVTVAIEAIAGANILHSWFAGFAVWQIGVALMALLTGVNLLSAKSYGESEFLLSSIKVGAIVAFILVGIAALSGMMPMQSEGLANLTAHGGFAPKGWLAVFAGVTAVIFALVGAEIATIAAAESAESEGMIARMTATVALRILVFYILSIALIVAIVPWEQIVPGQSPFAAALAKVGVPAGAVIMNIIVLVAVLSCLNSGLYVTSRMLFSLAYHGEAPRAFVTTSKRGVPLRAILISSLFAYGALAASVLSPEKVFAFLVNASGATMLFIYLLIAAAQWRLRNRFEAEEPARLHLKMWLHPYGTLLAMLAMLGVLGAMAVTPALAPQFYASLAPLVLAAIAQMLRARSKNSRSNIPD